MREDERNRTGYASLGCVLALLLLFSACGGGRRDASRTVHLYTSVTQDTVDAVVSVFRAAHPGVRVDVFRAPTGQLAARIAAEQRSGGVKADVLWATDPLSMHGWDSQHLLLTGWQPSGATAVPASDRTGAFWGTRVLYMVIVYRTGLSPAPSSWHDLTNPAYRGAVEIPDPGFAGSAFATLGYLSRAPGFGMGFYRDLKANGAKQVQSPDDVVTDVAEGRAKVGVTLEFSARQAVQSGSPVAVAWPAPGAISLYSPVAVTAGSEDRSDGEAFVESVLSVQGQRTIAAGGWQPVLSSVPGPPRPAGATVVDPDWPALFAQKSSLLGAYRSIFPA